MSTSRERAVASHVERWGPPELIVRAPGRVNLIGEHTDYSGGFVLPMALSFDTVIAVSRAGEDQGPAAQVFSEGFGEVELDGDDGASSPSWAAHMQGIVRVAAADGVVAAPWRGTIATDIPTGASLSSSAAIEVALGLVIVTLAESDTLLPDTLLRRVAEWGQTVETELLGQPTGIMDQLISATAEEGFASLIDCRSLEMTAVPLPANTSVVVMDTMTRRELVESEYSSRMATVQRAAQLLGVHELRDAADASSLRDKYPLEWQRATHVIAENARTLAAFDAMNTNDARAFGRLLTESHESLRDHFAVSGPALDTMVAIAAATDGCFGARMTGGGFAGCAMALVQTAQVASFIENVERRYAASTGTAAKLWECSPAAGASIEEVGL